MDRPLAPRRPSLKDVDFTVPTLEQQLKQVTDGPTVEKVEAPVNPYIEALIPGLEEAPQGDAVSPDLANVSKAIRDLIGDVDVKTAVSYAKEGGYLLKHCRNRLKKPHDRLFWVDMEVLAIRWTSPQKRKKASETIIYLTDVDLILPGEDSDYFKKRKKEERALGIELVAHTSKLRVVCKNYPEWRMWLRGLLYAHQKALTKRKRTSSLTNEYIRKIWLTADQDNSGSIQFNELIDLLQQLHVQMDLRYAEKLFCSYDEDGSHVLEYVRPGSLGHTGRIQTASASVTDSRGHSCVLRHVQTFSPTSYDRRELPTIFVGSAEDTAIVHSGRHEAPEWYGRPIQKKQEPH